MKRSRYSRLLLLTGILLLGLFVAACGADSPAPAADESAEAVATDEPEAEDNVEVVDTADEGSVATEITGVFVASDEDVSTPRDASLAGGETRGAATSDGVSFHPYLTTDSASSSYQGSVYDGSLLRLDENTLQYIPHMAESYTISDDGLTFTFNLRQDMQWSDGAPMTTADWIWTYEQMTNPDNGWPRMNQYSFITSYEALDDYTLQVTIDEVYAPALGQIGSVVTPLPKHVWEDLPWDDAEGNPEINSPSVTSGAYKLVEWKRDQYIVFEANENWWYKGPPLIQRSITEIVPDQDIVFEKFKNGETDVESIQPEDLEDARQLEGVSIYQYWPAAAVWSYIGLNMREGYITNDRDVRLGITYALDKQLMTDEIMLGEAKRLCGPYPDTSWVYNDAIDCYEYDVDAALSHFADAGYTYDADQNMMMTPEGEQMTLRLLYGPNTSKIRELIAVTVQDMLNEVGIIVEIEALEWSSFLEATSSEEPEWDMFIGAWRSTIEPHIMFTIWAEESIPNLNSAAYINKEVERLFEEGGATYDLAVRAEKYNEVQRLIVEDAPYVFLFYSRTNAGVNDRVKGVDPRPLGLTWNSEDWYIQEP